MIPIENYKAILSYESHGGKVSIERPSSDLVFDEFIEMVRSLALAAGYAPDTINEYLGE